MGRTGRIYSSGNERRILILTCGTVVRWPARVCLQRHDASYFYVISLVDERSTYDPCSNRKSRCRKRDTSFLSLKLMPIYITLKACLRQKEKVSREKRGLPN